MPISCLLPWTLATLSSTWGRFHPNGADVRACVRVSIKWVCVRVCVCACVCVLARSHQGVVTGTGSHAVVITPTGSDLAGAVNRAVLCARLPQKFFSIISQLLASGSE